MEPGPQSLSSSPRRRVHRASRPHHHNHPPRPNRSSPKYAPGKHSSPISRRDGRQSSSPRRQSVPRGCPDPQGNSAEKTPSPFHKELQDILGEVFSNGARGPTEAEVEKLAGDLGDLITNALVAELVEELKEGLLERLLIEYLEEIVSGVVTRKKKKNRSGKPGSDGKAEWKKSLVKRAFGCLIQQVKH